MDKKSNKKYFLNIILILVLGATVIYFTMKDDLHASLRALTTASPLWIVISFASVSYTHLLKVNPEHAEALMEKCLADAKKRRLRLDRMA